MIIIIVIIKIKLKKKQRKLKKCKTHTQRSLAQNFHLKLNEISYSFSVTFICTHFTLIGKRISGSKLSSPTINEKINTINKRLKHLKRN